MKAADRWIALFFIGLCWAALGVADIVECGSSHAGRDLAIFVLPGLFLAIHACTRHSIRLRADTDLRDSGA